MIIVVVVVVVQRVVVGVTTVDSGGRSITGRNRSVINATAGHVTRIPHHGVIHPIVRPRIVWAKNSVVHIIIVVRKDVSLPRTCVCHRLVSVYRHWVVSHDVAA